MLATQEFCRPSGIPNVIQLFGQSGLDTGLCRNFRRLSSRRNGLVDCWLWWSRRFCTGCSKTVTEDFNKVWKAKILRFGE
ncbi:hypothetical protein Nepgr_003423 [Nepenthes gracilis]|uniref:Uncharacterized protein n=1 Tax=Nepenthes gracilis TaxID=150966 RepID=A0AAD3RZG4_NEPGR|nr:hypothetical protein Nepgr_003423 [Nepenthes gracilis]